MEDAQSQDPEVVAANILAYQRTEEERDLDRLILDITQGRILAEEVLQKEMQAFSDKFGLVYEHAVADLSQKVQQQYFSTAGLPANAMNSISPEIQRMLFLHDPSPNP